MKVLGLKLFYPFESCKSVYVFRRLEELRIVGINVIKPDFLKYFVP